MASGHQASPPFSRRSRALLAPAGSACTGTLSFLSHWGLIVSTVRCCEALPPGAPGWGEYAPTEAREVLPLAAIEVLLQTGPAGFSLNGVLRHSGVSKGSFFHHYGGVDELLVDCMALVEARLTPELTYPEFVTIEAYLARLGQALQTAGPVRIFFTLLAYFGEIVRDHPRLVGPYQDLIQHSEAMLASAVRLHVPVLEPDSLSEWSRLLSASLTTLARDQTILQDPELIEHRWSVFTRMAVGHADFAGRHHHARHPGTD